MPTTVTMTGPGTSTVTDDAAVAIAAFATEYKAAMLIQNKAITGNPAFPVPATLATTFTPGSLGSIDSKLRIIAENLAAISDVSKGLASSISGLNSAIGAMSCTFSTGNALQASMIANQIQTNNHAVAAVNEALERTGQPKPTVPASS